MIGHVREKDIAEGILASKGKLWRQAAEYAREPKIYLHWTAGHYNRISPSYHLCILGNGDVWQTTEFTTPTAGTWRRNSGAVNLALCGCFDATCASLGSEPPTNEQIETMAKLVAVIAEGLEIPVDKKHVLTHGEAANNEDGYTAAHNPYAWWNDSYQDGDTRGDLEYLGTKESPRYNPQATDGTRGGDVLRGKANWYLDRLG